MPRAAPSAPPSCEVEQEASGTVGKPVTPSRRPRRDRGMPDLLGKAAAQDVYAASRAAATRTSGAGFRPVDVLPDTTTQAPQPNRLSARRTLDAVLSRSGGMGALS